MFSELILDIGAEQYGKTLFALLRRHLSIRQMVIYRSVPGQPVEALTHESAGEDAKVKAVIDRYIRRFHQRDPLRPIMSLVGDRKILLRSVDAVAIRDEEFRDELYRRGGIAGKLSLVVRRPSDTLTLSMFRSSDDGPFGERHRSQVNLWSQTLAATLERHFELSSAMRLVTQSWAPHAPHEIWLGMCQRLPASSHLSERELSVVAEILHGITVDGIAVSLGISVHSVVTYRRRAYAKLGITTRGQLMALALRYSSNLN